jgi:hypothetical protein
MAGRNVKARLLDQQFAELSSLLFPGRKQAQNPVGREPAGQVSR